MNRLFVYLVTGLFVYSLICFFPQATFGDTVSNDNYSIDIGNIDTNPQPTPAPQVLGTQEKSPFTTGPNYTVNTSNDSFSVTLSQNNIDYGILSSTNPVVRTSDIIFSNPQSGAEILTSEDHPLFFPPQNLIQNTTCDNGACTSTTASLWTNTLTYGFGYRCDSQEANVCDPQFSTSNYFKQYPNAAAGQNLVPVMIGSENTSTKATITYKVNISGTQKAGGYYDNVMYLAIPNF
ncbi:MAG TPA: hypothetical protein VND99_01790 [Candidatus Acidoferrales bacterium]|nr:hypothetical protein [Candidatus Acidoferrales bacterium]